MTALFASPAPQSLGDHIHRLTAIEAAADTVFVWQPMLIPGLLQTYSYAAAAIHANAPAVPLEVVDEWAATRGERIDRLTRAGARSISVVIDETALYRPVGGYGTLVDQLEHLLSVEALQPRLTVQVAPQGLAAHPGLLGAFTVYRTAGQRAVFAETLTGSTITARPEDVAAYASAWEQLHGLALPVRESVQLIDGVRETLCRRLKTD